MMIHQIFKSIFFSITFLVEFDLKIWDDQVLINILMLCLVLGKFEEKYKIKKIKRKKVKGKRK